MLFNHLKIAWRHLKKNKVYTAINVLSLTLGITSAYLILMYIQHELSYDQFHEKKDRIVRMTEWFSPGPETTNHFARCSNAWQPWMHALEKDFPEIKAITRLSRRHGTVIKMGENRFSEHYFFFTDSVIFDVFTIPMIEGDPKTVLKDPNAVIITESMANKYLKGNALGQTLTVLDLQGNKSVYQISGIMHDWPANSHLHINFLAANTGPDREQDWAYTYLLLRNNVNPAHLEKKLPGFIERHFGRQKSNNTAYHLQSLTDIHLHSHLDRELKVNGNIYSIYVLSIIIILIIVIAAVNYVNLSTAQAIKRSREMQIRRMIGSSKGQLVGQFLTETMMVTVLAGCLSIFLIYLFLPVLNNIVGKSFVFNWTNKTVVHFVVLVFGMGLLSGFYPSLALSRMYIFMNMKPNVSLPGSFWKKVPLKTILVIIQFGISAFLLTSTLVLKKQLAYINQKPLGFNKDQVISVGKNISQSTRAGYHILRNRLLQHPNIVGISACLEEPSYEVKDMGACNIESVHEGDDKVFLYILTVDEHFIDLMDIKLLAGTPFSASKMNPAEMTFMHNSQFLSEINRVPRNYIINETALKHIGFKSPDQAIGKHMDWQNAALHLQSGPIIGVVSDFHFSTLHKKIKPFVLVFEPRFLGSVLVKLEPENIPATLSDIEHTWNEMFPEDPFEYHFLDELFAALYINEQRLNHVVTWFTLVALFIGCIGLFGLVMHTTEQRTKEIGIRKVVGAFVPDILYLLVKDFAKWVIFANLIVWPIAYFVMNKWLENFAYRIHLTFWPFLLSAFFIITLALLTTSWLTIRAAIADPAKALRHE